jgi:hypothetical protein
MASHCCRRAVLSTERAIGGHRGERLVCSMHLDTTLDLGESFFGIVDQFV